MIIGFSRYTVNGVSLLELQTRLSFLHLLSLAVILFIFCMIIGIVAWYENEKKCSQLEKLASNRCE